MQNKLQCLVVQYDTICETVNTGTMQTGKIRVPVQNKYNCHAKVQTTLKQSTITNCVNYMK